MPYEPLVYVDEGGEVFANPLSYGRSKRRFVEFRRGRAAEPGRSYRGLRVQVGLIREPGYDPKAAPHIRGSADVYALIREHAYDDVQEAFYVVLLNARSQVLGIYEAHRGTMTGVEVQPADVLRPALVSGAAAIVVAHNHPSGDADPSHDDKALTKRLTEACKIVGVQLLDHLVIGEDSYVSFADRGLL